VRIESRTWHKFGNNYSNILDRTYLGIDLGERLTYSAVAMNPARSVGSERIYYHERSQGHLMEPFKKFQRWLNHSKPESVASLERGMTGADSFDLQTFRDYAIGRVLGQAAARISEFHNTRLMKYRKWQMKLALKKVMDKAIQELLQVIGCDSRSKWNFNDGIGPVIGIGLGKFRFHQDSVHAKFAKYLTQKARAIGIVVVGINEYYTSQKCPSCGAFLFDVIGKDRVKYCETCNKCLNRDNAAAENICSLTILKANGKPRPAHLMEPHFSDAELGIGPPPGGGPGDGAGPSNPKRRRVS
jgi:hypothetical protein